MSKGRGIVGQRHGGMRKRGGEIALVPVMRHGSVGGGTEPVLIDEVEDADGNVRTRRRTNSTPLEPRVVHLSIRGAGPIGTRRLDGDEKVARRHARRNWCPTQADLALAGVSGRVTARQQRRARSAARRAA